MKSLEMVQIAGPLSVAYGPRVFATMMVLRCADPQRGRSRLNWISEIYISGVVGPRIQAAHASHAVLIHGCSTYIIQPLDQ